MGYLDCEKIISVNVIYIPFNVARFVDYGLKFLCSSTLYYFFFRENTQYDNIKLTGRSVVDVLYFVDQILNFPHHGLFSCTSNQVYVKQEYKSGLISTFVLTCKICNVDY